MSTPLVRLSSAVLLLSVLAANPSRGDETATGETERAKLKGVWQLVFAESDGNLMPTDRLKTIRVEIKDGTHSVFVGDQEVAHEVPFTIDPKASPKATDDTIPDGPDKGKHILGIYRVSDDTLVSCVSKPGAERPKEFAAGPGSGQILRVFLRVKPDEGAEAKALREDVMRFGGTWRFAEMTMAGQKLPESELSKHKLVLQGNQFISTVGALSLGGHYKIDPSATPKTIDVLFDEGSSFHGIYELSDDTYRVSFNLGGKERPTTFESKPGTKQVVEVLKKVKPETK